MFAPPTNPVMPPPPPPPPAIDMARSSAMAEEALSGELKKRKGRGSTIVAGALGSADKTTTGTPTLLG